MVVCNLPCVEGSLRMKGWLQRAERKKEKRKVQGVCGQLTLKIEMYLQFVDFEGMLISLAWMH